MKHIPRAQKRRAVTLRQTPTEAEIRLWSKVRMRQMGRYKFSRQITIGPYIADIVCRESPMVIELDGGQHSDAADARRQAFIEAQGYRVLRFWNNEALANTEVMLRTILAVLEGNVVVAGGGSTTDGDFAPPDPLSVVEWGNAG